MLYGFKSTQLVRFHINYCNDSRRVLSLVQLSEVDSDGHSPGSWLMISFERLVEFGEMPVKIYRLNSNGSTQPSITKNIVQ